MEQRDYRLSAVVYTDIVGFSRLMEQNETATLELMSRHNEIITRLAGEFKGTVIKTVGDAFLIDFPNTVQALRCSVAILQELNKLNQQNLPPGPLNLRIGIHLGDIYFFENDALGEGITIVSRLQEEASPGGICVSEEVYNLVQKKVEDLGLQFKDRGSEKFRNITREIHVYDVVLPGTERPGTGGPDTTDPEADEANARTDANADPEGDVLVEDRSDEDQDYVAGEGGEAEEAHRAGSTRTFGADEKGGSAPSSDLLKRLLEETRRAGRRLTVLEARTRLGVWDPVDEEELIRLRDRGFLRRDDASGRAGTGPNDPTGPHGPQGPYGPGGAGEPHGPWGGSAHRGPDGQFHGQDRRGMRFDIEDDDDDADRRKSSEDKDENSADEIDRRLDRLLRKRGADEHELIDAYRSEFERRMNMARGAMRGHAGSFFGVNAMLFFIWLVTGAGFPWFLFPLLGWGIGFATHRVSHRMLEQELNQVQRMQNPSRERIKWHRKLWKSRRAFRSHLTSTGMTSLLLGTINVITGVSFPWAVIPIGFMAIGVLTHWPAARAKEAEYRKKLDELGARLGTEPQISGYTPTSSGDDPAEEARGIREALVKQIDQLPNNTGPFDENFREMLDTYVHRIEQLTKARDEISSLMSAIPLSELEQDRRKLESRRDQSQDSRMIQEYDRSIEQIEKQKQSFSELTAEQEMLSLRARTAVNALKQMQIEFARMRSLQPNKEAQALEDLRSRTQDLTQYLRDLREGYSELEDIDE